MCPPAFSCINNILGQYAILGEEHAILYMERYRSHSNRLCRILKMNVFQYEGLAVFSG
ncbi:hypothetical protein Barb7_03187 [Bacteroidales bacterium Barb7]|nr:hypothetical protein Barb7_03187 [Bacteroidales bacterium Barb7]